jgi:hypothetical protein
LRGFGGFWLSEVGSCGGVVHGAILNVTLLITAYTPLKFVGVELFLGWIAMPFGPQRGQKKPHFSDRETFSIEAGNIATSLMLAPLTVICVDGQSYPQIHPLLQEDEQGRIHIDADALVAQNVLPLDVPGLMKIELEVHSRPQDMDVVYEYLPMREMEAAAQNYVNSMAALSKHPDIVALREAQEAAGIHGMEEGLSAMREAYARLSEQQQ